MLCVHVDAFHSSFTYFMPETSREYKAAVKSFAARKAGSKQPADILVRDDLTGTYCFQVERRSRAVTQRSPSDQQKPTRSLTPGESGPPEISGKPSWSRPFAAPSGVRIIFSWARKRDLQAIRQIRKPRLCCPYERDINFGGQDCRSGACPDQFAAVRA